MSRPLKLKQLERRRMRGIDFATVVLLATVTSAQTARTAEDVIPLKRAVVAQYAAIASAGYSDAVTGARALADSVALFVSEPKSESLNRARHAWIDARTSYVQTEAYRFADGPIDAVEGLINAWPIDENLIDYVEGEPQAGVINNADAYPEITSDLIVSLNEKGGEKNITAGFHAIEFLLWGQDLNDEGPGTRSHLDYVDGRTPNAKRRGAYLKTAALLLVRHLEGVAEEWAPDRSSNYRARLLALPPDEALSGMLKGIGVLSGSELSGERLTVPYETKEQEDEHSCFSDTTHQDIANDTLGIQNVFLGRYLSARGEHVKGPGLRELLARVKPDLANTLDRQIAASLALAKAIPAPFDRAILGTDAAPGRVAVKRAIEALRAQADSIAQAGATLGLRLNF